MSKLTDNIVYSSLPLTNTGNKELTGVLGKELERDDDKQGCKPPKSYTPSFQYILQI